MINTIFDFAFPDKNIFSPAEELFKNQIFLQTGLTVCQTLFAKGGKGQYQLYIWFDARDARIREYKEKENFFASEYLRCFGLDQNEYIDTAVNLLDFKKGLMGYCYGHSIVNVIKIIRTKFKDQILKVYLDYSEHCFVIVADTATCDLLKSYENEIKEICFAALLEFDFYGILLPSDVRVKILSKSDNHNFNDLSMTNFGVN